MPRVNWALSDEAKAVFDAFKKEKGLGQDEAANALLMEFRDLHEAPNGLAARDSSGKVVIGRGALPMGVSLERQDNAS
jgi:hypothetical protein